MKKNSEKIIFCKKRKKIYLAYIFSGLSLMLVRKKIDSL